MADSCNGLCLRAYEIGLPEYGAQIAYAHPECDLHGAPPDPLTPEQEEMMPPDEDDRCTCVKQTGDGDFCTSCGHEWLVHEDGGQCFGRVPRA